VSYFFGLLDSLAHPAILYLFTVYRSSVAASLRFVGAVDPSSTCVVGEEFARRQSCLPCTAECVKVSAADVRKEARNLATMHICL
jgi:hypothetical protein